MVAEVGSPESPEEVVVVGLACEASEVKGAARIQACGGVGARVRDPIVHGVDAGEGTRRLSASEPRSGRRNRWNESGVLSMWISVQGPSSGAVQPAVEGTQEVVLEDRAEKLELGGGVEQDCRSPGRQGVACWEHSMIAFAQQQKGVVGRVRGAIVVQFAGKEGTG